MAKPGVPQADKDRIVALFREGLSTRDIAVKVGWALPTVHRILQRLLPDREKRPAQKRRRGSVLARARLHGLGVW